MKTSTLLGFRIRALKRRLDRPAVLVAVLAVVGLALFALIVGGRAMAQSDGTEGIDGIEVAVRDRSFMFGTLLALVYSYTTFEVFFRAPDSRFLQALPLSGRVRFNDLFIRAVFLHAPLLLLPLGYALGLALEGQAKASNFAWLFGVLMFVIGIPVAILLHLWGGKSLLSDGSDLRKILAGAAIQSDAALLVYAPAVGLLVILVLGIFLDLFLRDGIFRGKGEVVTWVLGGSLLLAFLAFRAARSIAESSLHRILPRFTEVDVPPPYREDGIRRHVPGEWFARWLPVGVVPFFQRDIRQLRRRYRLDRILLVVFAAVVFKIVHDVPEGGSVVVTALTALVVMNGVLITSAFRLAGELSAGSLERTLPTHLAMERLGRLVASAIYPLYAAILTAIAVATTGDLAATLLVFGLGLVVSATLVVSSHVLANMLQRDGAHSRVALVATLWRLVVSAGALGLGALG